MDVYVYDSTYKGLLTVIFELFRNKTRSARILSEKKIQPVLLGNTYNVKTEDALAARVLNGIRKRDKEAEADLFKVFLSELPDAEEIIFQYIQLLIDAAKPVRDNTILPVVLKVKQTAKQVDREVHRMHAFVRFEKTASGIFFSSVAPDFNVLPLVGEHFQKRYADQQWVIYDTRRKCGLCYDLQVLTEVTSPEAVKAIAGSFAVLQEKENVYRILWKSYFQAVNIAERKNLKLQRQHLPRRYWKYLPEKQQG